MNIQIYLWPQNLMNIYQMNLLVYQYLTIQIYLIINTEIQKNQEINV